MTAVIAFICIVVFIRGTPPLVNYLMRVLLLALTRWQKRRLRWLPLNALPPPTNPDSAGNGTTRALPRSSGGTHTRDIG